MTIRVLYFAAARELAGVSEEEVSSEGVASASDVITRVSSLHPRLLPYQQRMRVAINGEIASETNAVRDGDELALLPPVAGGSVLAEVRERALSVDECIAAVNHPSAGGITVFLGVVRDHAEGKSVSRLDYEAYTELANKEMRRIVDALCKAHEGARLAVVHRIGTLAIGDIAVIVAASAPHRGEAFTVCRAAIDQIKDTVPIWKKEWDLEGNALWVNLEADTRK